MPFVNGTWVDDATGVPDQGMPPGMGDPTGAIVPAAQQTPMAPQQINPRPMLGGPQSAPAFTPSAVDVTGNPLQAPPVPLPAEDPRIRQQIQQGFQQLDRPSMTPGHLASTILSAPLTIPVGIIEELRGLMGGDTIQGWAQQARSRYNDPNFAESRAFGVQGPAEEPTFGDRFTGVVTGSAQRGAMAGKIIRQQIGAYNANRKAALRENKDVQQLQLGDINLQTETFKAQHQPELFQSQMDARRAATRASTISGNLSQYTLTKKQEDAATVAQLAQALAADPSLADGQHTSALMALAKGNLSLVKQALEVTAAGRTMPDASGLRPGEKIPLLAGQAQDVARDYVTDRRTEEQRAVDQAKIDAANARQDAETQRKAAEDAANRAGGLEIDLAKEARDRVAGFYKGREDLLQPPGFWSGGDDLRTQLQKLQEEQARVQGYLQSGQLSRADAYAIASGDYDPLATPIDQPTPMPTAVSPTPRATPTPRPADYKSPAQVGEEVLKQKMGEILGVRPTPMATPKPSPSKFVDLSTAPPEATRAAAAKSEAELRDDFNTRFWEPFAGKTAAKSGPLYESKWQGYLRKYGK